MKFSVFVFSAAATLVWAQQSRAESFARAYKVLCPGSETGCSCFAEPAADAPAVARVRHYQVVQSESGEDEVTNGQADWVAVNVAGQSCHMRRTSLRAITWLTEECPDPSIFAQLPFAPPSEFLARGSTSGARVPVGKIFPTFYNIAYEPEFPGEKNVSLYEVNTRRLLARVSQAFRDALDLEGTGRLADGRTLNVGTRRNGQWDYVVLPQGSFGLGIQNHYLYPFRTVAIDFDHLCAKSRLPGCTSNTAQNRKTFAGTLLHIRQLEGARLPDGSVHDGFVCAHDIGGAIKQDRIDLFVGPMGGGNPFAPECLRVNPLIEHGVRSLEPSDWHLWETDGVDPATGNAKFKRARPYEYRVTVPEKGLDVSVVKGASCKPMWNSRAVTAGQ